MKTYFGILIALMVISASSLKAQKLVVDSLALKSIDKVIKEGTSRIARTDTIEKSSRLTRITGFDHNNRIVKIESKNILSNLLKVAYNQTQYFDTFGNLILEIQSVDRVTTTQHLYVYNEKSRLTLEKTLVDGVEVKKIEYKYDEKGKFTEKSEFLNGVILNKKK
jgi:hypothetical protein